MNANTQQTVETVFNAIAASESVLSLILEVTGLDKATVLHAAQVEIPALRQPADDEASAYEDAKRRAETP